MRQFWHDAVSDKSFYTLQSLRKEFDFVLIGGWAVFLYTKVLKSKDIDIIVELENLSRLKKRFNVVKNERLKKYEIKAEGFDIDIYVPFWSELGLPLDFVLRNTVSLEGFRVPQKEILLTLKLFTFRQRKGTLKGKKDGLDIVGLLYFDAINSGYFDKILKEYQLGFLKEELKTLLNSLTEVQDFKINRKRYADFKKNIMRMLS